MPPPKEYHVLHKGLVEKVSRAQYYRIKANDSASTRMPGLQALLDSRTQANNTAPMASPSLIQGNHNDDEDSMLRDENSDASMDIEKIAVGDEMDDDDDLYYGDYHYDNPPDLLMTMDREEVWSIPPPDPSAGDEHHFTPLPD
ncbi:hypothetical protein M405DRAFT_844789 [Rhizopogon salebrosus TDB-379]|nr:hypothetical protein M405DRAFT_844789 [Rhizopogon salebrosus TDB-379]